MGLSYLDGNNENMYAIKRLGSTFSDAVLGMAQAKARQQQAAQQAFVEQQYLNLARNKDAREATKASGDAEYNKLDMSRIQSGMDQGQQIARLQTQRQLDPQAIRQLLLDPKSGPQMMGDLRSVGAVPDGGFEMTQDQLMQRLAIALSGRLAGVAGSTPAGAGRMIDPVIMSPNQTAFDPINRQPMMNTGPGQMSPYQAQALRMRDEEFKTRMGQSNSFHEQSYNATLARNAEQQRHNKATENKSKGKGKFEDKLKGASDQSVNNDNNTDGSGDIPTFSSEEEARAAGHQGAAVVRIKGVGVVKLN